MAGEFRRLFEKIRSAEEVSSEDLREINNTKRKEGETFSINLKVLLRLTPFVWRGRVV